MSVRLSGRAASSAFRRVSAVVGRGVNGRRSGPIVVAGVEGAKGNSVRCFASKSAVAEKAAKTEEKVAGADASMGVAEQKLTETHLVDYKPFPYELNEVVLEFDLGEEHTTTHTELRFKPNYPSAGGRQVPPPMVLDGDASSVTLKSIYVEGQKLEPSEYILDGKALTIKSPPTGSFTVGVVSVCQPQLNTALEGLYKSSGNFCTQCEAQGFRRITYFPDRPDVMAKYTTKIVADAEKYPVLLGNGNLVAEGTVEGGRHYATWVDPWKKPCYLFALVAGKLVALEDSFTTMSGRKVALKIWTEAHNADKTDYAMTSLIKSFKFDEERFGREYDLDLFNIVAVDDFNMGAMENKSLNVFNSRLVLSTPRIATDSDYSRIEGVVGHEYFHNWSGNRVTCRDWFQLSLKEGLTVYRDQEFSSEMNSRPCKRIGDVSMLRTRQFAEDSGPMAHPVRPASYVKMDNFYTVTVYEKGAEVIRMYETLLGREKFQKGLDLYFSRHDGQAVTTDDFFQAMCDASETDLGSFRLWYSQAGTPTVEVTSTYDASKSTLTLECKQVLAVTPDFKNEKAAQVIPVAVGLIGVDGKDMALTSVQIDGGSPVAIDTSTYVMKIDQFTQTFTFHNIAEKPTPSILRGFSAPIRLKFAQDTSDLLFLFANDSDPFNRWEAGQRLLKNKIFELLDDQKAGKDLVMNPELIEAFRSVLSSDSLDKAFMALAVSIPSVSEIVDSVVEADPIAINTVRRFMVQSLAKALRPEFEALVASLSYSGPYVVDTENKARRALRNTALGYIASIGDEAALDAAQTAYDTATNMTDKINALAAICQHDSPRRDQSLGAFYKEYKDESLVILKWLAVQAESNIPGNVNRIRALLDHEAFDMKNPNKCYSLFGVFGGSPVNFHAEDGSGYEFMADVLLKVDKLNGQVAARLVGPFTKWRKYDKKRQELMYAQLKRIQGEEGLSENMGEIVSKSL